MGAMVVILHAAVLAMVNLGSLVTGFVVYYLAPIDAQIAIQLPVALAINVFAFAGWFVATHRSQCRLALRKRDDLLGVGVVALLWAPLVFVPLHRLTTGYVTGAGNLLAFAGYQLGANLLVLPICGKLWPGLSFRSD